jgi:phosphohistidine phosphatase
MKQLTIIRHAEARAGGMDFERPLSLRGEQDAERMAKRLEQDGISADIILSSPAARAAATAKAFATHIGSAAPAIIWHDAIYNARTQDLIDVIAAIDTKHSHAVIVGHNPALSDVADLLQDHPAGYMPPCGVITIQFFDEHWTDLTPHTGTLLRYETP